jgi:hypothetical protein
MFEFELLTESCLPLQAAVRVAGCTGLLQHFQYTHENDILRPSRSVMFTDVV